MRAELVRDALERVLGSPEFDASERNRRFLAHIIDETMAGRADRLKGLSIAVDVFGRDVATFDSERDPVVRIEAAKLRRSLDRYYLTAGKHDALRIEIPKGTYVPTFLQHGAPAADGTARLPVPEPRPTAAARAGRRLRSSGVAAALGGVAALAVTAAWLWLSPSAAVMDEEPVAAGMQLEGPAVIMVPFEDLTGSEAGRLFAGGLTEELIANLMRFANLRIFAASGDEPTSRRLSEQLSVGYRIQGSVRRAPHRLRLVVHLIDVENGRYVWSETYDRSLSAAGIVDLQAEIAAEIAGRLGEPYGVINEVTADLFRRHRPDTLLAYDCVLKAFAYRRVVDVERYRETRGCLEQAVRDDPHYAVAWAMLAFALLDEYRWYGFGTRHGVAAALDEALAAAQRALELDPATS
jgi:adenylate cyclase